MSHRRWKLRQAPSGFCILFFEYIWSERGPEDSESTQSQLWKMKEEVSCGEKGRVLGGSYIWVLVIVLALSRRVGSRLRLLFLRCLQTDDASYSISRHAGLFKN